MGRASSSIAPLSETGLPIGGNSMPAFSGPRDADAMHPIRNCPKTVQFLRSEELRPMLRGHLGGVLFFDAGNVSADSEFSPAGAGAPD